MAVDQLSVYFILVSELWATAAFLLKFYSHLEWKYTVVEKSVFALFIMPL